jgi:cell division protein FtsW
MSQKVGTPDKIFIGIVGTLVVLGLFIFFSAALSVLARDDGQFYRMLFNQLGLGLVGGLVCFYVASKLDYRFWKKHALVIFIFSTLSLLLVFIPGLGFEHGGAKRWLDLGPISFQPAELVKLGFVVYAAAWFSWIGEKVKLFSWGLAALAVMVGIVGAILLMQPDTGTLLVIMMAGGVIYLVAGAPWKHIGLLVLVTLIGLGALVAARPYLIDRVTTFMNPGDDPHGSSYQVQQSLIAIGSGQMFGRGYGQSVQKFNYLPEAVGDSVFAVYGEEMGFFGAVILLLLYLAFALRGFWIAVRTKTNFGQYLAIGITVLITGQSLLNIASSLSLFPLAGEPLIFVSQGGTALLFALLEVGIIVNISKHRRI